jgi:hypothetical protein
MPILASDLGTSMRAALDAEGAEHYRDDRDIIPAINAAARWLTSVINAALGKNKFGEEIFRDLTNARVFQTSEDSRIRLSDFPHEVWTILAVAPLPETGSTGSPFTPPVDPKDSALRADLYHISSPQSADRLSVEEWSNNAGNPYSAGYEGDAICDELKDYAYLDPVDYNHDGNENAAIRHIEVRPKLNQELCTIFYVKRPTQVTVITDSVEYPAEVFQMLFDKALQYIAYKQGDQTNIFSVTQSDMQTLISTIS